MEQFEEAFSMHVSCPVAECNCGKIFWDSYNTGYDWPEGERESLERSETAIKVPYSIGRIELEGKIYCMDCTCWHERARRIEQWLRDNRRQIGEWYRLERKRLQQEAGEMPDVEE